MTGMPSESAGQSKPVSAQVKAELISVIPNLRAFAVSLCGIRTGRTISSRRRSSRRGAISIPSSRAPICRPGFSRFCGISIIPNIASAAARFPIPDGAIAIKLATAPAQNGHMDLLRSP